MNFTKLGMVTPVILVLKKLRQEDYNEFEFQERKLEEGEGVLEYSSVVELLHNKVCDLQHHHK